MAGLGSAQPPKTDAFGQLLSEYVRRMYTSQLQHLKVLIKLSMQYTLAVEYESVVKKLFTFRCKFEEAVLIIPSNVLFSHLIFSILSQISYTAVSSGYCWYTGN